MEEWRQIPEFPSYEINKAGQVRNINTGYFKKIGKTSGGKDCVTLIKKDWNISRVKSISSLLDVTFGTEKKYVKSANKKTVIKNCENCNWRFENKCSVINPGRVTEIELDEKCMKWEKEVLIDSERHYGPSKPIDLSDFDDKDSEWMH